MKDKTFQWNPITIHTVLCWHSEQEFLFPRGIKIMIFWYVEDEYWWCMLNSWHGVRKLYLKKTKQQQPWQTTITVCTQHWFLMQPTRHAHLIKAARWGRQTEDTHLRWSTGAWASVWGSLRSGSGIWSACSHCRGRKQTPGQRRRTVSLYLLGLIRDKWGTCSGGTSAVVSFEHKLHRRRASQRRWYERAPTSGHSGRNT